MKYAPSPHQCASFAWNYFKTFLVFTLQKGNFFVFLSFKLIVSAFLCYSPSSLSNVDLIQGLKFVATQSSSSYYSYYSWFLHHHHLFILFKV
jgi:hypothetical protein